LSPAHLAVAAITLATTVGLNIWTHGGPRFFCVLLGMITGHAVAATLGVLTWSDFAAVRAAPLVHVPSMVHLGWSFDLRYAIPFGVAALTSCLSLIAKSTRWRGDARSSVARVNRHSPLDARTAHALQPGAVVGRAVGAGPSATRYYLSVDAVKSAEDTLLTASRTVHGPAPPAAAARPRHPGLLRPWR
jgi:hypothetical protein